MIGILKHASPSLHLLLRQTRLEIYRDRMATALYYNNIIFFEADANFKLGVAESHLDQPELTI